MNASIALFLVFGACFGLLTYRHRHLFIEGPSRPAPPEPGLALGARLLWMMICSCLWPLMVLTGLLALWRLSRVPVDRR